MKPILKDLYVLVYAFVWNCLWLIWVICASDHHLAVEYVRELFASLWTSICTIGGVRLLSEDNLSILVVSLEDAVDHILAFVLNCKITDQLLWCDELWIFCQVVGLTIGKLLVSSGIRYQVLTWRLDCEGSGLN